MVGQGKLECQSGIDEGVREMWVGQEKMGGSAKDRWVGQPEKDGWVSQRKMGGSGKHGWVSHG